MKSYRNDRGSAVVNVLAAVAAVAVVVGLAIGAWYLFWNVSSANTDRQRQIDQRNYGSQLGYIQKIDSQIVDVRNIDVQLTQAPPADKQGLNDQRAAIVTQICTTESLLTSVPDNIAAFASGECR